MLNGVDLDKILDEDHGDAGYNDDIENELPAPQKKAEVVEVLPGAEPWKPKKIAEPFENRPVMGAAPPPPRGTRPDVVELDGLYDEMARGCGYKDAHELNAYMHTQRTPEEEEAARKVAEEPLLGPDLAPGIKVAPKYMPPGAYPGDRTKVEKEYDGRTKYKDEAGPAKPLDPNAPKPGADAVESTYVKQNPASTVKERPKHGNVIAYRTEEGGEEYEELIGSKSLPWALEIVVQKMKAGDVMEVVARGEHACADDEEVVPGIERRWPYFELIDIWGKSQNKFNLDLDTRLSMAGDWHDRGNSMFAANRYHRALNYYEMGSSLMDVLEMDSVGPMSKYFNQEAFDNNKRSWALQKPLLLNHGLLLMKFERWNDAERKCTELLMDIDKLNVKALYRRGVCYVNLGDQEQAKTDLDRAAELDTSLRPAVDWWLLKVEAMQRKVDKQHAHLAKKVVNDLSGAKDERSVAPPKDTTPVITPQDRMFEELEMQQRLCADAAEDDEDLYLAQRQRIYDQFMMQSPNLVED